MREGIAQDLAGLDALKLASISESDCNEWAKRFREAGYDEHYFNQALSTLRHILDYGELHSNPTRKVKRLGVKMRELKLPEPDQFMKLIANLEQGEGGLRVIVPTWSGFWLFSGAD
jgi:hypothetical protein